ncbi:MAG: hypothetical protein IKN69_04615, partial [Bacilli bacterium]|nr:hypothetical protein [Bacilli bacterium]
GPTFTVPLEEYNADKELVEKLQEEKEAQAKRIAELEEKLAAQEGDHARVKELEDQIRSKEEKGKSVHIVPSPVEEPKPEIVRIRRGYSKNAMDIGGIKTDPYGNIVFIKSETSKEEVASSSPKAIKVKKDTKPATKEAEPKGKVFRIKKAK